MSFPICQIIPFLHQTLLETVPEYKSQSRASTMHFAFLLSSLFFLSALADPPVARALANGASGNSSCVVTYSNPFRYEVVLAGAKPSVRHLTHTDILSLFWIVLPCTPCRSRGEGTANTTAQASNVTDCSVRRFGYAPGEFMRLIEGVLYSNRTGHHIITADGTITTSLDKKVKANNFSFCAGDRLALGGSQDFYLCRSGSTIPDLKEGFSTGPRPRCTKAMLKVSQCTQQ